MSSAASAPLSRLRSPINEEKAGTLFGFLPIDTSISASFVNNRFDYTASQINGILNNPRLSACTWSSGDSLYAGYNNSAREKSACLIVNPKADMLYGFCRKEDFREIIETVNNLCKHIRLIAEFPACIARVRNEANRDIRTAGYCNNPDAFFSVAGQEFCRINIVLSTQQTARFSGVDAAQLGDAFLSTVTNNADALNRLVAKIDKYYLQAQNALAAAQTEEKLIAKEKALKLEQRKLAWANFAKSLGLNQTSLSTFKFEFKTERFSEECLKNTVQFEKEWVHNQNTIASIFKDEGIDVFVGISPELRGTALDFSLMDYEKVSLPLLNRHSNASGSIRIAGSYTDPEIEPPIIDDNTASRIRLRLVDAGCKLAA